MNDPAISYPDHFPERQCEAVLRGPAGDLEAMLDVAEASPARAVAVICHSVSADGGSLHSRVVQMMERSLRELGAHTVRLNFRGVGGSEGSFDLCLAWRDSDLNRCLFAFGIIGFTPSREINRGFIIFIVIHQRFDEFGPFTQAAH